jgi:hypothetical protein
LMAAATPPLLYVRPQLMLGVMPTPGFHRMRLERLARSVIIVLASCTRTDGQGPVDVGDPKAIVDTLASRLALPPGTEIWLREVFPHSWRDVSIFPPGSKEVEEALKDRWTKRGYTDDVSAGQLALIRFGFMHSPWVPILFPVARVPVASEAYASRMDHDEVFVVDSMHRLSRGPAAISGTYVSVGHARARLPAGCPSFFVIDGVPQPDSVEAYSLADTAIRGVGLVLGTGRGPCPAISIDRRHH